MYKKFLLLILMATLSLQSKVITPSDVFAQTQIIEDHIEHLLNYYNIKFDRQKLKESSKVYIAVKPRDVWQKTYEIMVKINMLRVSHKLPAITPVNMTPVLNLNPDLVYEQTQRILTELKIFEYRSDIDTPRYYTQAFKGKIPSDVFNELGYISTILDKLNKSSLTPSYVFAENMRVLDDIGDILQALDIRDDTIPPKKNPKATPNDTFRIGLKILQKIRELQISVGISFVNFENFNKDSVTPSEVFTITQMILAELQTIKAFLGIKKVTIPASKYEDKTPVEVDQLMGWNLRKLMLIKSLIQ